MTTKTIEEMLEDNVAWITIQDVFAAAALAGWAAGRNVGMASFESSDTGHVARSCYDYAEAMMKEKLRREEA